MDTPTEVCCFIVSDHGEYESLWFYLCAAFCLDHAAKLARIKGIVSVELFAERYASSRAICWRWERPRPIRRARLRRTA